MTDTRALYIMISRTDTGMAQFIRTFSRYPYNHVSMTLDPSLRNWCSFARYHRDAPFYSGFIKEPVERFLADSGDAIVRIFRLDIPRDRARRVEQLFLQAGRKETRLIYNYYDAMASVLNRKIAIAGSYTCLSFACAILGRQYRRIADLDAALSSDLLYEGRLNLLVADNGQRSDAYFQSLRWTTASKKSANQLVVITFRFVRHRFGDLVEHKLHGTAA